MLPFVQNIFQEYKLYQFLMRFWGDLICSLIIVQEQVEQLEIIKWSKGLDYEDYMGHWGQLATCTANNSLADVINHTRDVINSTPS